MSNHHEMFRSWLSASYEISPAFTIETMMFIEEEDFDSEEMKEAYQEVKQEMLDRIYQERKRKRG